MGAVGESRIPQITLWNYSKKEFQNKITIITTISNLNSHGAIFILIVFTQNEGVAGGVLLVIVHHHLHRHIVGFPGIIQINSFIQSE